MVVLVAALVFLVAGLVLGQLYNLTRWDVPHAIGVSTMFIMAALGNTVFTCNIPKGDVSLMTTTTSMLGSTAFWRANSPKWDRSFMTTMAGVFSSAAFWLIAAFWHANISKWDVSLITTVGNSVTTQPCNPPNIPLTPTRTHITNPNTYPCHQP